MGRRICENSLKEIQELNKKGFVRKTSRLLYYIRNSDRPDIKFFRSGSVSASGGKGDVKYSSYDIFGEHLFYFFDVRRKKEFVDFLVAKFLAKNKNPDANIRKAFTRILHSNGLYWYGQWGRNDLEDDIQELHKKGFAKTSNRLLYYIRNNDMPDIKIFRTCSMASSRKGIKYSYSDIFGNRSAYCFDIRRKKEFVDFLVAKFFNANENPDANMRKVFTRILHSHGLHWEECTCGKKNKYDMGDM